jgi:hypothetical protein
MTSFRTSGAAPEKKSMFANSFSEPYGQCSRKIESQQGPKERTFLARLHEEVVIESRGNPPNFRRDNLFNSLLGFLPAHLSKARGSLKFSVRNLFGSLAFAVVSSAIVRLLWEDLLLGALGGAAEQLATVTAGIFSL